MRTLKIMCRGLTGKLAVSLVMVCALAGLAGLWNASRDGSWQVAVTAVPDRRHEPAVIRIDEPVKVHSAPDITLVAGELALPNVLPEVVGRWLLWQTTVTRIALHKPEIVIGRPVAGGRADPAATLSELGSGPAIIEITGGTLCIALGKAKDIKLTDVDAVIEHRSGSRLSVARGSARLLGREIGFALRSGKGGDASAHMHPLTLSVWSDGARLELDGSTTDRSGSLEAAAFRFEAQSATDVAGWLGLRLGTAAGPFTAEGVLTTDTTLISLDEATVRFASNTATGSIRLQLGAGRPLVDATLDFVQLDLAGAGGLIDTDPDRPSEALTRKAAGSAVPLLDAIDAELRLSADAIRYRGLTTGRAALSATWRNGGLTVQVAGLDLYDGTASGQLSLRPRAGTRRAEVALRLDGVALPSLLSAAGFPTPIEAHGDLAIALTAEGRSWVEARERLNGRIAVRSREGGLTKGGLAALVQAAAGGRANPSIDGLDLEIAIEKGVASRQRLAVNLDGVQYDLGASASRAGLDEVGLGRSGAP